MDWLIEQFGNFIFDHTLIAVIVGLVLFVWVGVTIEERRKQTIQRLRATPLVQPDRFPSGYSEDLSSELLLYLGDHEGQPLSIPQLKQALPHLKGSETQFWEALNRDLSGRVQGIISSEAPVGSPGSVEVYRVTDRGKSFVVEGGITPTLKERAHREFLIVSETLYSAISGDLDALDKKHGFKQPTSHEISKFVFERLEKISTGFLESHVEPLTTEPLSANQIKRTWLAHRLKEWWGGEFIRARTYAIDLCVSRKLRTSSIIPAVLQFDNWAAALEDGIWNRSMLLLLGGHATDSSTSDTANGRHVVQPVSVQDKMLLREILAEQPWFVSPEARDERLNFVKPPGFTIQVDLSGSAATVAVRVLQSLTEGPLVKGERRLQMLKNICREVLATQDLPERRRNQLKELVEKYADLWE